MGALEITTCGCSRSAFVWASSPRVAVRFAWVLSSWFWRMRLRPVRDSFCVVSDRIDAWLLESSMYKKPTPSAEIKTVDVSAVAHQRRSRVWNSRSEEHTSELQSHSDLVCRLLL